MPNCGCANSGLLGGIFLAPRRRGNGEAGPRREMGVPRRAKGRGGPAWAARGLTGPASGKERLPRVRKPLQASVPARLWTRGLVTLGEPPLPSPEAQVMLLRRGGCWRREKGARDAARSPVFPALHPRLGGGAFGPRVARPLSPHESPHQASSASGGPRPECVVRTPRGTDVGASSLGDGTLVFVCV